VTPSTLEAAVGVRRGSFPPARQVFEIFNSRLQVFLKRGPYRMPLDFLDSPFMHCKHSLDAEKARPRIGSGVAVGKPVWHCLEAVAA
jgi:hypothetical protein